MRWVSRVLRIGLAAAIAVPALGGCRQPPDRTIIAVLTPVTPAVLSTEPGRSAFADRVKARCEACVVVDDYDGATAASARVAVADGADVIVVEALTSELGEEVTQAAGSVPVVAFDRFVTGADWFVGYDRSRTAAEVVDALLDQLSDALSDEALAAARVLVVGGSADDAEAAVTQDELRAALTDRGVQISGELSALTGTAEEARAWVTDQLRRPGGRGVAAVLASTDEQAQGVVAAFAQEDLPRPWPPVTGAGGELRALRLVVRGEQALTVHSPVAGVAERAADVALSLASAARGSDLAGATEVDGVPAYVVEPVVVSVANLTDTVVRDGTFTPEELCAGDLEAACAELGIR